MAAKSLHPLVDILEQFRGKSPDQIAETIRRRGIKGRSGTTHVCPMALLLRGQSTGDFVIGRKYIARRSGTKIEKVHTPANISTFVRRFDIGKYPELMAPSPRCLNQTRRNPKKGERGEHKLPRKPRKIVHHLSKLVDRFSR